MSVIVITSGEEALAEAQRSQIQAESDLARQTRLAQEAEELRLEIRARGEWLMDHIDELAARIDLSELRP